MLHACDEDENRKNDHENGSHWHDFDVFVVTEREEQAICVLFPEKFAEDYLRQTRRTKDEMGRQHQGMDRLGVRQVPEGNGKQRNLEETGCEIICDAPKYHRGSGIDDDDDDNDDGGCWRLADASLQSSYY